MSSSCYPPSIKTHSANFLNSPKQLQLDHRLSRARLHCLLMTRHNTVTNGPWARHNMDRTLTYEVGHWLGFSCVRAGFSS
ncbi:hypothetical protein CPC08DRAFT_59269 [Agrocybe pediades]|nr:hypothetical protein CPC08DRAFT_59269 [Agrocybe pediades]